MNGRVDLLPADCREQFTRRTRVRRWVGLYVAGIAVLVGAHAWLTFGRGAELAERDALKRQAQQNWERNEEAQDLVSSVRDLG
ncbi:MAG: hypothetical protein AAFX05_08045, partial [Planctomycetota bacterium]